MSLPATAFSSSSSSSAVVRVDKATSEFLNGPDWTLNIDICDTINANSWLAKDVAKALKKRLQHKNPHVQLLSLTLLETMVKNCGERVHIQIAERGILPEMIKIVKKKADMRVREKILVLLDSWQQAFGGRGGKYPQYYFAYDELQQYGVQFPHRSPDAALIFTPPVTHPPFGLSQANYGIPTYSSTSLDEAMASEIESLSVSMMESMRNVSDLLSEMLQEVDPNDRAAVKDEVIVDVVDRCRSNQKKLMHFLASTSDDELLGQGIELNDYLQTVLEKHDAIASGSPIPVQVTGPTEEKEESLKASVATSSSATQQSKTEPQEEEEVEDDFALLARRHTKAQTTVSQKGAMVKEAGTAALDPSMSMALTLTDPFPPTNTTKADDMIHFLSLALSVSTTSPTSQPPPVVTSAQNTDQSPPVSAATQNQPQQTQQPLLNNYVVPWAQSEPQPQVQPEPQYQQQNHYSSGYIPPPWAATPGYYTNAYASSSTPYTYAPPSYNNIPSQQVNSYSNNLRVAGMNGDRAVGSKSNTAGGGQRSSFIPSYRLFEDLNVLGNQKTSGASSNFSGSFSHNMK
ncbi:putative VHS domain, GAT domain, GAT domain superfamily protein [Helianthus annuus]|nr:putative TOM1-like protein, plant [Helianthus annuus]KAJ0738499.1 putative TOM1-like protein, plant [Helianthus annuus]KAJ0741384.1 putative TOM1-like protein, plant [Helianthus annuus]KAJ0912632.1 putative VHS domain, GAT domain, GAT domain superfamily protein [Helianthus annuus]